MKLMKYSKALLNTRGNLGAKPAKKSAATRVAEDRDTRRSTHKEKTQWGAILELQKVLG